VLFLFFEFLSTFKVANIFSNFCHNKVTNDVVFGVLLILVSLMSVLKNFDHSCDEILVKWLAMARKLMFRWQYAFFFGCYQGCLGIEMVSDKILNFSVSSWSWTDVSRLESRSLGPVDLFSGLGPLRLDRRDVLCRRVPCIL